MYTKLATSILTSTVWMECDQTRIVWLTLLAMKDKNGEVQASIPGLANVARVTIDDCQEALTLFLSPDPFSRTKTDEGRRIEEIDGGWVILNHDKYRDLASGDDTRRKAAERQRRYRDRLKRNGKTVTGDAKTVTGCDKSHPISHTDAEPDTDTSNLNASDFKPPTLQEVTQYCQQKSNGVDPQRFMAHYESTGWRTKTGPVKSWRRCVGTFAQRATPPPPKAPSVPSDTFEDFWQAYPRKEAKAAARAQYAIAETLTDAASLLKGAKGYARFRKGEEKKYTLTPKRWLEEERWSDEYPVPWYDLPEGEELDRVWEESMNAN